MKTIRLISNFAVLFFSLGQATAQSYYPGGLGNTNLLIWLNANKTTSITQNGANQVSQWSDLSGHNNHFGQATTANAPIYGATAAPNGRPALKFTSTSSQYLGSLANLPAYSFTGGVTSLMQISFNAAQTAWGWQRVYDIGNGQANDNINFGRRGSTNAMYYEGFNGGSGDQTYTTTAVIGNGFSNLYEAVQSGGATGSTSAVNFYSSGNGQGQTGAAGSSITWVPSSLVRTSNFIGRSNWAVDDYYSGTMSEILFYNTALNTTQRVIAENYISAGWNQAVSVSKYTPPTTTTYGTNLVGIGYTSFVDNFLTDVSGSTDGLGFSSGSGGSDFLNTAGYLMGAHNGQANTVNTNATIWGIQSASAMTMWDRSWNVQKTGGNAAGLVTLVFNFGDYNGSTPTTGITYQLLYNATTGTFMGGTNKLVTLSSTTVSAAAKTVSFGVNAANLANGYYTIIYSNNPIVLPISLTGFTATKQDNTSLLKWDVAEEINVDHYEIQRRSDANDFTTIGTVAAASNSSTPLSYTFTDGKPAAGKNYYRLSIIDRDNAVTYSPIRAIDFGTSGTATLNIYPNPVAESLHIGIDDPAGQMDIRVINTQGQIVRTVRSTGARIVDVPVKDLNNGVYVVEVNGPRIKYSQLIFKN